MILNLPNSLTLFRIAVIPLLVGSFFLAGEVGPWLAAGLFVLAGLTDYFDGFFARMRAQESAFGTFLDPVADKLIVSAALFMMVAFDHIGGLLILPALVILCREILVSGLREFLAGLRVRLPVTWLAKWKTALQMIAITCLLLGDAALPPLPLGEIGAVALWCAAGLTLITGWGYLRASVRHMQDDSIAAHPVASAAPHPKAGRPGG